MRLITILGILLFPHIILAQNYTSYFTGNTTDVITNPGGGVCLMGGATEDDNAMSWFLNQANGGDVIVLRASGSDGYNDYLYTDLGVTVNSVETIVFNNATASSETYIHNRINEAEAIWFAGGDQWNYVDYWRGTTIQTLINEAINSRNVVVGGTSAGMAILGGHYFSAENGTITSNAALNNPYNNSATVDNTPFLEAPFLANVITDTHYDNPNRKGRHSVFLARILTDTGTAGYGIACDEYTAVCIDTNGIASVYGEYPTYDDFAYFIQVNCEATNPEPEVCTAGTPLTWNLAGSALRVARLNGTASGGEQFDLNTWQSVSGGSWLNWSISNGNFSEVPGLAPDCALLEPCVGDFNDDGMRNVADLIVFLADVGCTGTCIGDFNGDGTTNIADLISHFTPVFGTSCQ